MNYKTLIVLSGLSLAVAACSVPSDHVDNSPPTIHKDLVSFSTTFGAYQLALTSAFLWPQVSEDEVARLVKTVNGASMKADPLFAKGAVMLVESQKLQAQWDSIDCVRNYAVLGPDDDPDIGVDHVSAWQTPKDDKGTQEIPKCQANQTRREELKAELADNNTQIAPYINAINVAIDPDQTHVENSKSLNYRGSRLSILQDEATGQITVSVKLSQFLNGGYSPSTDNGQITNATYDVSLRSLSFDVADVDVAGRPTGLVYKFVLERGPNNGPLASFRGDMNLRTPGGAILRYGSARIDGFPPQ